MGFLTSPEEDTTVCARVWQERMVANRQGAAADKRGRAEEGETPPILEMGAEGQPQ